MTRLDPPPFRDDAALARVWEAIPSARVVGGAVRDAVAGRMRQTTAAEQAEAKRTENGPDGRSLADIDLASPLSPGDASAALTAAGIRVVPTGLAHGTVTAVLDGRGFEITTLRRDLETDGRHAVVAFTDDWQEDAARRDFTINAMSMTRDGTVFDYFGGIEDLRAGRLRFVGAPDRRIAEDYLRILRFFRFQARYGSTEPDTATLAALRDGIPGLGRLSAERVWHELRRILAAPRPDAALGLMWRLGIGAAVLPEARPMPVDALPPDPVLRLAALLIGDPALAAARLKLSNADRDRLLRLRATPAVPADADDTVLRRLLARHRRADLNDRMSLDRAPAWLHARLAALPDPVFPLEGRDLLAAGLSPGPAIGALLADLRAWWLDGGCTADRTACLAELARRVVPSNISAER